MRKIILKEKCKITSSIFKSKNRINFFFQENLIGKRWIYLGMNNDNGGNQ
jgi:hypothetical protein